MSSFGCAKCCSYSISSHVQYDDFTHHTWQKAREAEIHSDRFRQRKLNTYRLALIATLISTLTDIGYFRSTRDINEACSTSTPHAQSSLVNHLPVLPSPSYITSWYFHLPPSLHPSIQIFPLNLLRFTPNPCVYASAIALQKQQK